MHILIHDFRQARVCTSVGSKSKNRFACPGGRRLLVFAENAMLLPKDVSPAYMPPTGSGSSSCSTSWPTLGGVSLLPVSVGSVVWKLTRRIMAADVSNVPLALAHGSESPGKLTLDMSLSPWQESSFTSRE